MPNINRVFLFLGVFSLFLSCFDLFYEHDIPGGILAIAWGLLILFMAFKRRLVAQTSPKSADIWQFVFIALVIVAGFLKLLLQLRGNGVL